MSPPTHEHPDVELLDVLIIGAGISGVSCAVHLARALPDKRVAILEKREAIGGTWDLFRYPGVRSDSDMYTLGFGFKPWEDNRAIADGWTIRDYIRAAAAEHGIDAQVRFGHRVTAAAWDSPSATWTVTAQRADGDTVTLAARFLHFASGYYSYEQPYAPEFPGQGDFAGPIIHPQLWPEGLDTADRRVVVIGSGATAMTLVPALAAAAGPTGRVTMLQRSPSYVISLPAEDDVANLLRKVLPHDLAYSLTRSGHLIGTYALYEFFRRQPGLSRRLIRSLQKRMLPGGYPIDEHFNPRYDPWDQRLCIVPDADLFTALGSGRAEIVTDTIERFTPQGIRLTSGRELAADIIVTATGLNLELLGGAQLSVDGRPVDLADTVAYKGAMYSGVPNLALTFGYINASWTLKADLISTYICRLLAFMDERGYDAALPIAPPPEEPLQPFVSLSSGYITRVLDRIPRQGSREPWLINQSWLADVRLLRRGPIADEGIRFFSQNVGTLEGDESALRDQDSTGGSDSTEAALA